MNNIEAVITAQGGKLTDIDRCLDMPIGSYIDIIQGYVELTIDRLEAIAAALDMDVAQLLRAADWVMLYYPYND